MDTPISIILFGSGRSGTTWVENIINFKDDYRILFEPFYPKKVKQVNSFLPRQYMSPNEKYEKKDIIISNIIRGNIRSSWIDQMNKPGIYTKRIIKDIRINLMINHIHKQHPKIPILFLIRNPCAVANSRIELNWNTHLDEILKQRKLFEDYLYDFKIAIKNVNLYGNNFEKQIMLWCIENYLPIVQFKNNGILILRYEEICIEYEKTVNRMFNYLGIRYSPIVEEESSRPSQMTQRYSEIDSNENKIIRWRKNITKDDIKKAKEILELFNMNNLFTDDLNYPIHNYDF